MPNYTEWPGIPNALNITAQDHAAHTTRKGIHHPSDLGMTAKHGNKIFKAIKIGNPLKPKGKVRSFKPVKRRKKT